MTEEKKISLEEYMKTVGKKQFEELTGTEDVSSYAALEFYPIGKNCPVKGGECKKDECEWKMYKEELCLYFEMQRVFYKVFNTAQSYFYPDYDNVNWAFCFHHCYPEQGSDIYRMCIEVNSDNSFITELVLKRLGLGEKFTDCRIYLPRRFESLEMFHTILEGLSNMVNQFKEEFVKAYTCSMCGSFVPHDMSLYEGRSVCGDCKTNIVIDIIHSNRNVVVRDGRLVFEDNGEAVIDVKEERKEESDESEGEQTVSE